MLRNPHLDRVRQAFADQFSRDDNGCLYRKYQKGAPIRVSETERGAFIATFNRHVRYAMWSIIPATFGLILLLAWLIPDSDSTAAELALWAGMPGILVPWLAIFHWAWNAPSRELERRPHEGAALAKEEARALAFSRITYGNLALAALIGAALIWKMSATTGGFHGPGLVGVVFGAGLIVGAGVQAIRKWCFSQS